MPWIANCSFFFLFHSDLFLFATGTQRNDKDLLHFTKEKWNIRSAFMKNKRCDAPMISMFFFSFFLLTIILSAHFFFVFKFIWFFFSNQKSFLIKNSLFLEPISSRLTIIQLEEQQKCSRIKSVEIKLNCN